VLSLWLSCQQDMAKISKVASVGEIHAGSRIIIVMPGRLVMYRERYIELCSDQRDAMPTGIKSISTSED